MKTLNETQMSTYVRLLLLALLILVVLNACKQEETMDKPAVARSFEYKTSSNIRVDLQANPSLAGASFELYSDDPNSSGKLFAKGVLDASGSFSAQYKLGTSNSSVYFRSTFIGLYGDFHIPIENGKASYTFFQPVGATSASNKKANLTPVLSDSQGNLYKLLASHTNLGVPTNLEVPNQIDASLLSDINAALPEQSQVPLANPGYLANGNDVDLHLKELSDVWITFVHEGAGYKNVLAYYTYPSNQPPQNVADIDTTFILFPNTSFSGSGGGLKSGDKIHLGQFAAGTSIGWVLIQDAFDPNTSSVQVNKQKFYSNHVFNPEPTALQRQHTVQLYHAQRNLVLIGFEDIQRHLASCDQDFNDAIFYLSSNPVTAVESSNLPTLVSSNHDADQDGVHDQSDEYPSDPTKAFNQYYPDAQNFSSLAFEDLWPAQGDYDFNDLVVDQQYKLVTSGNQLITEIELKLFVRHIGASYSNGFGIELPIPAAQISQVIGYHLTQSLVTLNSRGLEANQSKAVLIAFEDAFAVQGDTIHMQITLSSPYSLSMFNQLGVNPFIFVDGNRGREVHLINHAPTDLANPTYFQADQDHSEASQGVYYRSAAGYPWALEINHHYKAPKEKTNISEGYKFFNPWVHSGGTQHADWFAIISSEYRDFSKLQP
jgi:LruC domain-containing protein